jgi:hypothetical protein
MRRRFEATRTKECERFRVENVMNAPNILSDVYKRVHERKMFKQSAVIHPKTRVSGVDQSPDLHILPTISTCRDYQRRHI